MAFDIDNKISQIKKDLERLEAELDSFNRANYDGSENSNIRKKQKQIKEKQLELLKYRNVKAMQQKDTAEILRLSGFMVDGDIILPQHEANDEEASPKFKKVMEEFGKGELESSSGEKVTDPKQAKAIAYSEAGEAKDGGPGSGIKGHTTPENEKPSDYDEKEIEKIKAKWKGKESVGGHGSEYGDILNHLEQKATKAGTLPDMDEYFKLNDKLIDLRQSGKKDTEEYKSVEKQRNDFNKKYNKAHKALKEKARSLSSESEQKRLGELDKMTKGAKDDDATKEGAIKKYGKEKGSFEDACNKDGGPGSGIKGHTTSRSGYKMEDPKEIEAAIKKVKASGHANPYYLSGLERALQVAKEERGIKDDCGEKVFTKGTEDAERSVVWVKPSGIEYKIGDIIQFKGQKVKISKITGNVIEATVMDACTKDADPKVAEAEAMIKLFGGVR